MYIAGLEQTGQLGQLRNLIILITCYARQNENLCSLLKFRAHMTDLPGENASVVDSVKDE